ncbi:cell division topological specificity factor [Catenovulum agarivorans DS-2]|uniref:Cell division topological specificity factor n=1 Tax=Catenovulum agarivorans DS-2 TaxID=1328313 RepID=W7QJS6_9ALTE|nr:cell division topological specificity factor MinE [Catenovulum agarivorans]EWH12136.1 cell division topological specificity factor [Catenovulum agarivorans DS-2]
MSLLSYFRPKKTTAANQAKERLQIIVAQRRRADDTSETLSAMEKDILEVIRKYYMNIDSSAISVQLEQNEDDLSVLELNVTLPDDDK